MESCSASWGCALEQPPRSPALPRACLAPRHKEPIRLLPPPGAFNDWNKDRQFQKLNAQKDIISVKVVRAGKELTVPNTDVGAGAGVGAAQRGRLQFEGQPWWKTMQRCSCGGMQLGS